MITKLLNSSTVSQFVTRRWNEVNDLSSDQYFANKNITLKTLMLRSDLCDYSDGYIVLLLKMKMIKQGKINF